MNANSGGVHEVDGIWDVDKTADLVNSVEQNSSDRDKNYQNDHLNNCAEQRIKAKGNYWPQPVNEECYGVKKKRYFHIDFLLSPNVPNSPTSNARSRVKEGPSNSNNL